MSCNSDAVSVVTSTAGERSTPPRVDEGAVVVEERRTIIGTTTTTDPPKGRTRRRGILSEEETGQNGQSHILHSTDNKAC